MYCLGYLIQVELQAVNIKNQIRSMNSSQWTACLAKGYTNSKYDKTLYFPRGNRHDWCNGICHCSHYQIVSWFRWSTPSETDDAGFWSPGEEQIIINHHRLGLRTPPKISGGGGVSNKNIHEEAQLDHTSKFYTDGQLFAISTVGVRCWTDQALKFRTAIGKSYVWSVLLPDN